MNVTSDKIPLCAPEIGGREWEYVKECLDTGWVSSVGAFVDRFECDFAARLGAGHAVATVNGTAALHVALLVAGVEPGDEVLVSDLTFIAPANAIRYAGAWPVLVDAEPAYWQMDPAKATEFLERGCDWQGGELRNRVTGRRVRAIVPVHILGHPVDLDPLLKAARRYGLAVIEDATESLGASYRNRPVGRLGDIACFSFNGNKLITTGGGGMIITDKAEWASRAKFLTTQAKTDPVEFVHREIGFNYRLTNLQAAVGCAQLERLDEYIAVKRRIAKHYTEVFARERGLSPMPEAPWAFSVFWLYTVRVDPDRYGSGSRDLLRDLARAGIQCRPLWQPLHLSPAHRDAFSTDCSVAERLNREALSIPCSVGLSTADQERVIGTLLAGRAAQRGSDAMLLSNDATG